jgi:hypothetical protein
MDEPASMGLVPVYISPVSQTQMWHVESSNFTSNEQQTRSRANHPKRFIGGHTMPQKKCSHPSKTTHGGWVSTKM